MIVGQYQENKDLVIMMKKQKKAAVQDYLSGEHDITKLTTHYHIKSASTVLNWVLEYKHRNR